MPVHVSAGMNCRWRLASGFSDYVTDPNEESFKKARASLDAVKAETCLRYEVGQGLMNYLSKQDILTT